MRGGEGKGEESDLRFLDVRNDRGRQSKSGEKGGGRRGAYLPPRSVYVIRRRKQKGVVG